MDNNGVSSIRGMAGDKLRKGLARLGFISKPSAFRPITLPTSPEPDVSIVIPAKGGARLTHQCLDSILHSTGGIAYEVIIVDDGPTRETREMLASISGIRVIENETSVGALLSANRGVSSAQGEFIALLNNDTEPQPGWLEALLECANSHQDVGAVTAKLLYMDVPDHTLQEAGGIVWRDGTPWRFGDGDRHWLAEYNFTREVDYGSAAALLVRQEAWESVGGFDEQFRPAYWEDTDLCFALRNAGWKVMYEPVSVVLHHGGRTMGVSPSPNNDKKHLLLNQPKFVTKWAKVLADHPGDPSPERALLASNWRRSPTVLIIDHALPTPDKDSGSLRMMNIIRTFVREGWRVVFLPENRTGVMPYLRDLRQLGVEVLYQDFTLAEHLAALSDDLKLVILSRPYVAARFLHEVRESAPRAVVAYDTVDLHFRREEGRAVLAPPDKKAAITEVANGHREVEAAMCRAADIVLAVSNDEYGAISALSSRPVHVVGNANRVWSEVPGPETREGLVFAGDFAHPPNVDAAEYLVNHVMPLVWEQSPDTTVLVVGANPPSVVQQLASPNVKVTGWVEDLSALLAIARVSVAPVRFGAGVKGKVTEALAAGIPVVTTTLGAQGLPRGAGLSVADETAEFADLVLKLLSDDELWRRQSIEGQHSARMNSSEEQQASQVIELIKLAADLGEHREGNTSLPS